MRENNDIPQWQHRIGPALTRHQERLWLGGTCHGPTSLLLCTSVMTRRMRCHDELPLGREGITDDDLSAPEGGPETLPGVVHTIFTYALSFARYRWRRNTIVSRKADFSRKPLHYEGAAIGRIANRQCRASPIPLRRSLRRHRRRDPTGRHRCRAA